MKIKYGFYIRVMTFVGVCLASLWQPGSASAQAKNAILFIGDGMGFGQVTAARIFEGNARDGKLTLDTMEHTAIVRTYSADMMVTDSASAGTAMASGVKTNNGMVGQLPNGTPILTILEMAKAQGKSVGVVSTTRITHATPACFYAHVESRNSESEIAAQLVDDADVDVILGGGRGFFLPEGTEDPEYGEKSKRTDKRDLMQEMRDKGYRVVQNTSEFESLAADVAADSSAPKVLGLFNADMMSYEAHRAEDAWGEPSIAEMTELAIEILSRNPKGYFLMVEGGRIDHASHSNQAQLSITDLLAFDRALKVARDATDDAGDTLIVVTADHETGGLSINGYPKIDIEGVALFTEPSGRSTPHTVTFATGPGADKDRNGDTPRSDPDYYQPAVFSGYAAAHTGVDVGAWASGPGAEAYRGSIENTEIARKIIQALGLQKKYLKGLKKANTN